MGRYILMFLLCSLPLWIPVSGWAHQIQSIISIRKAAAHYALMRAKHLLPAAKLTAHADHLDPHLQLSRCDHPLQISVPAGSSKLGHTVINVRCTGNHRAWQLYVPVTVSAQMSVLVAARPLDHGVHIKADMLSHAIRNVAQLPYGYFSHARTIIGQVLSRNLVPGAVITPAVLHSPLLVQRGQVVTLSAGTAAFSVTTQGVALQGGAHGALVRVRNNRSHRVVQGIVTGSGQVRITG